MGYTYYGIGMRCYGEQKVLNDLIQRLVPDCDDCETNWGEGDNCSKLEEENRCPKVSIGFQYDLEFDEIDQEMVKEGYIDMNREEEEVHWNKESLTPYGCSAHKIFKNILFAGSASGQQDNGVALFHIIAGNGKVLDFYETLIEYDVFFEDPEDGSFGSELTEALADALESYFWSESYERAAKEADIDAFFTTILQKKAESLKKTIKFSDKCLLYGNTLFWENYFDLIQKYKPDWTEQININLFDNENPDFLLDREWLLDRVTPQEIEALNTRLPEDLKFVLTTR